MSADVERSLGSLIEGQKQHGERLERIEVKVDCLKEVADKEEGKRAGIAVVLSVIVSIIVNAGAYFYGFVKDPTKEKKNEIEAAARNH